MELVYYAVFALFAALGGLLLAKTGIPGGLSDAMPGFMPFRNNYLLVYSLSMRELLRREGRGLLRSRAPCPERRQGRARASLVFRSPPRCAAATRARVLRAVAPFAPTPQPPSSPPPKPPNTVGDWLQGPYVYALYESYGYSPAAIGQLFIAGFGSSLVFGTVVGALSDRLGRRNASLLYVLTYSLSCVTKHSPNFHVLMLGRVLGGIATSLLFSAFEAWLVAEHFKRGFSEASLGDTFAWAIFLGNGLMAIVAGFAGNYLVENMGLGRVAPFDAAIVSMVLGGVVMLRTWSENYGDRSSRGVGEQFERAWAAIVGGKFLVWGLLFCVCLWVGRGEVLVGFTGEKGGKG
jgi:hypothetical protein